MKFFAYDIEGGGVGSPTLETAVARAKSFDAIVAGGGYRKYASQMRAANPNLKLMIYTNGTHTTNATQFPSAWYLHDSTGKQVRAGAPWQGNLLMNPLLYDIPWTNAAGKTFANWTEFREDSSIALAASSGYNAIYVDELGTGCISNTSTGWPIDPRTGIEWTKSDWMDAMGGFLTRLSDALNIPVWCNGLGNSFRFYLADAPTSTLLSCDGAASELYMRGPEQPIDKFPTPLYWGNEVRMTVEAGPKIMTLTKTWTAGTKLQKDAWHRFALTTFLLGAHKDAMFYFTYERANTVTAFHAWWGRARKLGIATEAGHPNGNGWSRSYAGGVVFVNPTSAPVTFAGVANGFKLNRSQYSGGAITVPAYSGEIITVT